MFLLRAIGRDKRGRGWVTYIYIEIFSLCGAEGIYCGLMGMVCEFG